MKYIEAQKVIINPLYDSNSSGIPLGDIALIKTEISLKKLQLIPVKVAKKSIIGEKVWSIGYGLLNRSNMNSYGVKRWLLSTSSSLSSSFHYSTFSEYLQLKNDTLKYNDPQNMSYIDISKIPLIENSFLIIKKKRFYYSQICDGDSGGPQFVKRGENIALIGISEGFSHYLLKPKTLGISIVKQDFCNSKDAVSTRVAPYLKWINSQLKPYQESLEDIHMK